MPLMSIARHRSQRGSDVRVVLLYAVRTWDDVVFRDELIARDEAERNFDVLFSLSRDSARRPQDVGRRIDRPFVRSAVERVGAEPKLTFVCGSNPFVEAATSHLVDLHLPPETIRTERSGARPGPESRSLTSWEETSWKTWSRCSPRTPSAPRTPV